MAHITRIRGRPPISQRTKEVDMTTPERNNFINEGRKSRHIGSTECNSPVKLNTSGNSSDEYCLASDASFSLPQQKGTPKINKSPSPVPENNRSPSVTYRKTNKSNYENESKSSNSVERNKSPRNTPKQNQSSKQQRNSTDSCNYSPFLLWGIVLMATGFVFFTFKHMLKDELPDLETSIAKIATRFPSQSADLWAAFHSGIEDSRHLSRPSVFILVYPESPRTAETVARSIATVASTYLQANDTNPLEVTHDELTQKQFFEDHGRIITTYKPFLISKRVMLIYDLHLLPGKIARAFHPFCDEFSPLVRQSVLIFTMKIDQIDFKNVLKTTEDVLIEMWNRDLDTDILMPLVTRVTGSVHIIR